MQETLTSLEDTEELLTRPAHLEQDVRADEINLKPKQARFVLSKAPYCAYGGGVGNGKTLAALIKVHMHCEANPGAYFLIGRKYFPELRDSTMRDFLQLMGDYGNYRAGDKIFDYPNGSQVIFRHLDNQDSLTNLNLSGFYVDQAEDIPEATFDYLSGRCRLEYNKKTHTFISERLRMITFNPKGHDWIWRLFDQKLTADGEDLPNPEDYHLEVATTFENRDNLPADYLKSLESKPKIWKDRFMYGSFDTKAGRIFEEWNRAVHIIPKGKFEIPPLWEKFRAIDHGQTNPTSCHWYAVDFDGNIYVYREYYKPNATVSTHVKNINTLSREWSEEGMVDGEYSYTVIDPSTHAQTREKDGYKFSVAHEYLDAGIATIKAQNDVTAGINRVREYMRIDPERYHPFLHVRDLTPGHPLMKYNVGRNPDDAVLGSPKLFVFEDCEMLIKEIPEYEWQPLKYNQIGLSNEIDKPVKNFDHAVDDLRYAIMSRPLTPSEIQELDSRIWENPLALARYAQKHGVTVEALNNQRYRIRQEGISRSSGRIKTRSTL